MKTDKSIPILYRKEGVVTGCQGQEGIILPPKHLPTKGKVKQPILDSVVLLEGLTAKWPRASCALVVAFTVTEWHKMNFRKYHRKYQVIPEENQNLQ